jgi:hypothetical protein
MGELASKVRSVRNRQQFTWLWQAASMGLLAGGAVACALAIVQRIQPGVFPWTWILSSSLIGLAVGTLVALIRFRSLHSAAREIDRSCGLKDRVVTALDFQSRSRVGQMLSPVQQLQLQDAENHARSIDPILVAPIRIPRSFASALVVNLCAAAILLVPIQPDNVLPTPVIHEVVNRQADKVQESLQELRAIQEEQKDPELEKLLQELQSVLQEMKEPGVDPKEAMAKLSEMESALMDMQAQLKDPESLAQMEKVGEALALSPAMAQAGNALAKGEMEKAAEQLAKLEMPELDRQTEKAMLEKLEQAKSQPNKSDGASQKKPENNVDKAAEQMSQGLTQGNRSKFSEGAKGLSGEAKKLSNKKKLSDLLKKQSQCLSECKSECEGECQSQSDSKSNKPSNKAGKASGDKTPGEKTLALSAKQQMKLKGQETGQGQSDIETEKSNPQEEESLRAYREQAEKFESLSESALETESIPMGHRQTIRKYFESIRPSSEQVDQVKEKTK